MNEKNLSAGRAGESPIGLRASQKVPPLRIVETMLRIATATLQPNSVQNQG